MYFLDDLPQRLDAGASPTFARVLLGDGSTAAPGAAFFGEPSTGILRPSPGIIRFTSLGTNCAQIYISGTTAIFQDPRTNAYMGFADTGAISITAQGTNQGIALYTSGGTGYVFCQAPSGASTTFRVYRGTAPDYGIQLTADNGTGDVYFDSLGDSATPVMRFRLRTLGTPQTAFTVLSTGTVLYGTGTDSANGRIQLATHTTVAGGIGWGTDTPIFRQAAGQLCLGTASYQTGLSVNGSASGTAGGAFLFAQLSGSTVIGIGNYSAVFGGAYSASPILYGNATIQTNQGFLSYHATAGIGYAGGSGGAVTQTVSRTQGVTLSKVTGDITLVSAAGSTTYQSFTLTNTAIAATDCVDVVQKSGTDLYEICVTNVAAGSCRITFRTTGGTTTEQPVFHFNVIKGVNA